MKPTILATILGLGVAFPATAQDEPAGPDRESEAACLRAAALEDARIGTPIRYSDDLPVEARIVKGRTRQTQPSAGPAEGGETTLLCLYHRGTRQAETRAFDPTEEPRAPTQVRDVWWHAENIGGRAVIGRQPVTLMVGSDGKLSGHSGCNIYTAQYTLVNQALEVVWPMTGTRRACEPVLEAQEDRFRRIVLNGMSLRLAHDGALILTARDGSMVRFVRAESRMRPAN